MKKLTMLLIVALTCAVSANAATIWVDLQNDMFHPMHLYVPTGTTIVWTNYDNHQHTVTSNTNLWPSDTLAHGQTFSFTFNSVGDYGYHCNFHPMMVGTIYVRTTANLSILLNLTPLNPPIVIPNSGGSFQYTVTATNQTQSSINFTYWNKLYPPGTVVPFTTFTKSAHLPPNGIKSATLTQSVASTAVPGLYRFVGLIGTNPDSVIAWNSFTFTKSAFANDGGNGWETIVNEDWHDVISSNSRTTAPINMITDQDKVVISNAPEPFNPSTTISFTLPAAGTVRLEIYNLMGARVADLINGNRPAGENQATFDGSSLSSGMYVARLNYNGEVFSNKMMLTK